VSSGGVTIPAGSSFGTPLLAIVPVQVNGDLVPELDESFSVILTNASNAQLGSSIATVTLQNDDGPIPPDCELHPEDCIDP
jgi:hypothetical protein